MTLPTVNYWLSKPNPSAFGVESLYFTFDRGPAVIDRFTLDPLTPGVYFHVYYSSDQAGPGTDNPSWENLLWTPVYKTFVAQRATTYALPTPIAAKYIKMEFSGLQARYYIPGDFQKASRYRKYPKWVLDYFLTRFAEQDLDFLSSGVDVAYDAIDLAYSYYSTDLVSDPDPPPSLNPTGTGNRLAMQTRTNQVDPVTLTKIGLALQPYLNPPALQKQPTTMIGTYAASVATTNYSTETITPALADTSIVSSTNREALLLEKQFPLMFFFIPSRHRYRTALANFDRNVAYFAGVNTIAFHRDQYAQAADQTQYNEILGDGANCTTNDFLGS